MRYPFIILASLALCVSAASPAVAATFDWSNSLGGTYNVTTNWSPNGIPTFNDVARLNLASTYAIAFTNSPSISTLTQTQGDVTLNLNTNTFTMSNATNSGMGAANFTSTLRVNNGNFRPSGFNMASVANSTANLYLDLLTAMRTNAGVLNVGSNGVGNLWLLNGSTLQTTSGAVLGTNLGAVGSVNVSGQDSAWTNTNQPLRVGSAGTGTLNILSGGSVTTTNLEVGELLGSTGTISLNGNLATLTASATANIGGTLASAPAASATLNIGTGSTMSLNGTTNLRTNAKVNVSGGTLNLNILNITSGATVNWTAGTVNFATAPTITTALLDTFLAGTHTLGSNRTLSATAGTLTLTSALDLTGGKIAVPTLVIGTNMDIGAFSSVIATNTITLQTGTTVQLGDFATLGATTSVNNNGGTLLLNGPLANVTGPATNTAGFIRGTGRFTGGLNNAAAGTIRSETDDHLIIDTAAPTNVGTIELAGGTVEYTGALSNNAGGTISGRGIFRGSSAAPGGTGLNNQGVLSFSAGITDIYGDVNNTGTGQIIAAGGSTVTFYDDVVNNGTEIRTVAGSRTVFFGSVTGAGPFTGTGVVELEGDLKPGNSPANVTFGGNVAIGAAGGLDIELAGTAKGTQYDSLTIAGSASLGGVLNTSLIDGFMPSPGQSFEIIKAAGGISSTFDTVNLPALAGGLFFNLGYTPTAVTLSVAGMLGDYNHNGAIDAADYVVWRKTMNQSGAGLAADANNNGVIDSADFTLWRSKFGSANLSGAGATIPEPATAALFLSALGFGATRRRRRDTSRCRSSLAV